MDNIVKSDQHSWCKLNYVYRRRVIQSHDTVKNRLRFSIEVWGQLIQTNAWSVWPVILPHLWDDLLRSLFYKVMRYSYHCKMPWDLSHRQMIPGSLELFAHSLQCCMGRKLQSISFASTIAYKNVIHGYHRSPAFEITIDFKVILSYIFIQLVIFGQVDWSTSCRT